MPNQKLLETIACLSRKQKNRLKHFVDSPYHNTKFNGSRISLLLTSILEFKKTKQVPELDKQKLNQTFFPQSEYKVKGKNSIDSLASDLFSLVQKFIADQDLEKEDDKARELFAMARFYRMNNMENRFLQTVKQFRTHLAKTTIHDAAYFLNLFKMEEEVAIFQSTFSTYTGDPNLIAVNISLDNFYVISKLEFSSALQFHKNLGQINTPAALRLSKLIVEEFPHNKAIQSPLAQLNYQVIKLFESIPHNKKALEEFLSQAISHKKDIRPDKYRNLMAFYRYFVGRQYQLEASGKELINRMFIIYKEHLSKGYFHANQQNHLLPSSLKLMVNIALKVGDVDWAKKLLTKYPPSKIAGTHFPDEAHSLCMAEVLFYEHDYLKAHDQLVYKNFETINYSILAEILLVKIYYMIDSTLLVSKISALSQKIRRSKLSEVNKAKYLNFIKLMKLIIKYRSKKTEENKNRIKENLVEVTPLIEREWMESLL